MSYDESDYMHDMHMEDLAREQQEEALNSKIEEAITQIPEGKIRDYIDTSGKEIAKKINQCLLEAKELLQKKYYNQSLITAFTALEIIIRDLVLKPFLKGVLLYDEWSDLLTKRILSGRFKRDSQLLPEILEKLEIGIKNINLSDGSSAWPYIESRLNKERNNCIHQGLRTDHKNASLSIECAQLFMDSVAIKLAKKVGSSWPPKNI